MRPRKACATVAFEWGLLMNGHAVSCIRGFMGGFSSSVNRQTADSLAYPPHGLAPAELPYLAFRNANTTGSGRSGRAGKIFPIQSIILMVLRISRCIGKNWKPLDCDNQIDQPVSLVIIATARSSGVTEDGPDYIDGLGISGSDPWLIESTNSVSGIVRYSLGTHDRL